MNYMTQRRKIKTGDILAWTHRTGWFKSWYDFKINLVRLGTRSEYSHVAVAVLLAGRVFVLESVTGGIRLMPLSKCLPCYHVGYKPMDLDRAMSVCGEPYSQLEAVLGQFNRTNDKNGVWQCSEFVRWVHELPCPATPSAVVEYALAQGGALVEITIGENE